MPIDSVNEYIARLPTTAAREGNLWLDPVAGVMGRFYGCHLTSVFQPVVALGSGATVGHEAFIRSSSQGSSGLSPWNLFALAAHDDDLVALDRLCRTVHALNYYRRAGSDNDLFLNVHGRLLAAVAEDHGRAFRRVADALGIVPRKVVIETPESTEQDLKLLSFVLVNYRLNGFRVAANVSRISQVGALLEHVRPDFLKVDSRQIVDAAAARSIVELAEQHGVGVIFRRVEDDSTLLKLIEAGAPLAQGYALGRPDSLGWGQPEPGASAAFFSPQSSALAA